MSEFKLVQATSLKRDVSIIAPDDSKIELSNVEFLYMSSEDYNEALNESGDDLLFSIVLGWDKCADGAGNELKYSAKALKRLATEVWVKRAFFDVFVSAITGADRKNYSASLELGLKKLAEAAQKRKPKVSGKKQKSR